MACLRWLPERYVCDDDVQGYSGMTSVYLQAMRLQDKYAAIGSVAMQKVNDTKSFIASFKQMSDRRRSSSVPVVDKTLLTEDSNPFGDFVEMVDVTIKMMELMADTITDQIKMMNDVLKEMTNLSRDIVLTMGDIDTMAHDIQLMMQRMSETEELMSGLMRCLEAKR